MMPLRPKLGEEEEEEEEKREWIQKDGIARRRRWWRGTCCTRAYYGIIWDMVENRKREGRTD